MTSDQTARVLSLLSHELRGPLGVIRGYLRLLEQTGPELSDQHRQAVSAALKASNRALDLLTQTSMLAQLQRDETPFNIKFISLKDLVSGAIDGLEFPKDPAVRLEIGDMPTAMIAADAVLLGGAIATLVAAVARAQAREATVKIACQEQERDGIAGVMMTIAVGSSSGAPAERTLDTTRGGVGLDLPIAQELIARHRGDLRQLQDGERLAGMLVWLPTTA
jgi:signal transduction histidine kinase